MMLGKFVKLVLGVVMIVGVTSCDKPSRSQKDTNEDRLIYSFKDESPDLKQHVEEIVREAKDLKYHDALNKLALLSATRRLTKKQKYAVDAIVRQLRYDMEEEIFSEKTHQE